jgi:DNA-binding CsgD family transcriptional regulator
LSIFGETHRSRKSSLDAEKHSELADRIQDCFSELTPREARILQLRFGLVNERSYTLEEVGQKFGITGERIRQIQARALAKLRHPTIARRLREYVDYLIPESESSERQFSASRGSRTLVATFSLVVEDVVASGRLPPNVPTDYVALCDWLEEDLRRCLVENLGDFSSPEASQREGETISVRIAFRWNQQDGQPDFGDLGWWSLLELLPFEEAYPDRDAAHFWSQVSEG